ncbi:MAG: ABC transporter permease [Candidatus Syntropharchaeia archaeon]
MKERRLGIVTLAVVGVLWQLLPSYGLVDKNLFPPPTSIFRDGFLLWINEGTFLTDMLYSLLHWGLGLSLGFLCGFAIGIAMGWFRIVDGAFYYLEELIRPVPPIAWIPAMIIWFGISHLTASAIIFIGAFFPVLINCYSGARNVDRVLIDAARVLGARNMVKKVVIPYSMPFILTGLRIAIGACWMCVVAAEMFGTTKYGLGWTLFLAESYGNMALVFAGMITFGILGLGMDIGFRRIEARILRWRVEAQ